MMSNQGTMMTNFNTQSYQASSQVVPGVRVVNETPYTNPEFPIRYRRCLVLAIGILKIIFGGMQFFVGIADIFLVPYYTSRAAFPIWCGILFIVNGIIGICSYKWPSKCMIGSFLCLSIASLILSLTMMGFVSDTWHYFDKNRLYRSCSYSYSQLICSDSSRFSDLTQDLGIGLSSFVVVLSVLELALSISAVVFTCQAYSKCCNTCNANDCCSCVGCCECDIGVTSNIPYQDLQTHSNAPQSQPYYASQAQPNSSNMQTQQQLSALQRLQNASQCSALINIIINFPGVSRAFNVAATGEPTTTQLTFQDDNAGRTDTSGCECSNRACTIENRTG